MILTEEEKKAIRSMIGVLKIEDEHEKIQNAVFETAKKHGIKPARLFKKLYMILIGVPRGPRMGPYMVAMGRQNVITALKNALKSS